MNKNNLINKNDIIVGVTFIPNNNIYLSGICIKNPQKEEYNVLYVLNNVSWIIDILYEQMEYYNNDKQKMYEKLYEGYGDIAGQCQTRNNIPKFDYIYDLSKNYAHDDIDKNYVNFMNKVNKKSKEINLIDLSVLDM